MRICTLPRVQLVRRGREGRWRGGDCCMPEQQNLRLRPQLHAHVSNTSRQTFFRAAHVQYIHPAITKCDTFRPGSRTKANSRSAGSFVGVSSVDCGASRTSRELEDTRSAAQKLPIENAARQLVRYVRGGTTALVNNLTKCMPCLQSIIG